MLLNVNRSEKNYTNSLKKCTQTKSLLYGNLLLARLLPHKSALNVQLKFDIFTVKQLLCSFNVVLVDVYISEVERY